jgi:hypothetical protein
VKGAVFALIARKLECNPSQVEARKLQTVEGWDVQEDVRAMTTFQSPKLQQREAGLLAWARDTVHYQTGPIQQATRALCAQIGELALLEAVGVASLANSTVRVAMLLE